MTAMAMSPQNAVFLLLQTEPGIRTVLDFGGPVGFAELPLVANAVLNSKEPVRFADPDFGIADRADLVAASDTLDWLNQPAGGAPTGDDGARVQVVEPGRWRDGVAQAHQRDTPFPAERVVACIIDVPGVDHCLVVPTGGGAGMADTIMLYGRHRRPSRWTLVPFGRRRNEPAMPVNDVCELSDDPTLGCEETGCVGNCIMETAYLNNVSVMLGCGCH